MVGNISRVKGLETFIRMAAEANVNQKNLEFVVVGPIFPNQQNYYDSLCDLASEHGVTNIEFVGGREDVRPLLKLLISTCAVPTPDLPRFPFAEPVNIAGAFRCSAL
jgi:glycosyltransferase involved in cell wall biosynthesis